MKNFRDLKVWEKAHLITLEVYKSTSTFPREELYGLTSQIRRCSASIAANIAEGCGRGEMQNFIASCRLLPVPPANWITTFCWPGIFTY